MYGNVKNTARILKYITLSGLKTGRDALVDGTWVERLSKWLHWTNGNPTTTLAERLDAEKRNLRNWSVTNGEIFWSPARTHGLVTIIIIVTRGGEDGGSLKYDQLWWGGEVGFWRHIWRPNKIISILLNVPSLSDEILTLAVFFFNIHRSVKCFPVPSCRELNVLDWNW